MKPKNFPGRVNARRKAADPLNPKIMRDEAARSIRTKKAKDASPEREFRHRGKISR